MKKSILTLVLATVVFLGCKKDSKNEETNNNKAVVSVQGTLTPYKFGKESSSDSFLWSVTDFNTDGTIKRIGRTAGVDKYDRNKSYMEYITYSYSSGQLSEKKDDIYRYSYQYSGKDTTEIKKYGSSGLSGIEKRFISEGRIVKSDFYLSNSNSIFRTEKNTFDQNGNKTTVEIVYPPKVIGSKLLYTYDAKGNILTETYNSIDEGTSVLQRRLGYKYDSNDRIYEFIKNSLYTIEYTKYVNTYNSLGNIIKMEIYKSDKFDGPFEMIGVVNYSFKTE